MNKAMKPPILDAVLMFNNEKIFDINKITQKIQKSENFLRIFIVNLENNGGSGRT